MEIKFHSLSGTGDRTYTLAEHMKFSNILKKLLSFTDYDLENLFISFDTTDGVVFLPLWYVKNCEIIIDGVSTRELDGNVIKNEQTSNPE